MNARAISCGLVSLMMAAASPSANGQAVDSEPFVGPAVTPRPVSVDLRDLPKVSVEVEGVVRHVPRRRPDFSVPPGAREPVTDPVRQTMRAPVRAPDPTLSFDGVSFTGFVPPDTVGDVGPSHYIQMVNAAFAVYDKSGTLLAGPSSISSIFAAAGMGAPCGTSNDGDPIVLYDPLADRWLLSQFVNASPPHQCIAVSQASDPVTGGFFAYDFTLTQFPDYPKFGVWPDAYYMGANSGVKAYAFDRVNMLAGSAATFVSFSPSGVGAHSTLLPSDLDGSTPPPADSPGYFIRHIDGIFGGSDRLELFEFDVDFATPGNSTFTGPTALPTAAFGSLCSFSFDCIDQPDTLQDVDSITEWPMWRLAYRNFGAHEAMVINHSVDVGSDQAGVRWYELRKSGAGVWSIHQQGTWAPDSDSRWMASAAMDRAGNLAIGYNVSSDTVFPSLRYAARLADDPAGQLTQGEATLVAGGGSQTGANRWGDYSSLNVDPADDCTYWFTGEYYASTSAASWRTRIGTFVLPGCECVEDLVLEDDTITGTESFEAGNSVTLGENLEVNGTAIDVVAGSQVIFKNNVEIGGAFSAGTSASVACP